MKSILLALLLAGCSHEVIRYRPVPLPIPSDPELPTISRDELSCLEESVYSRLVYRELLLKQDRSACKAVICTTRTDCPKEE